MWAGNRWYQQNPGICMNYLCALPDSAKGQTRLLSNWGTWCSWRCPQSLQEVGLEWWWALKRIRRDDSRERRTSAPQSCRGSDAERRDGLGRASSGRLIAVSKPLTWIVPSTPLSPILNPQGLLNIGYRHPTPWIQPRAAAGPPAPTAIPRAVISEEPSAVPCHHHPVPSAPTS